VLSDHRNRTACGRIVAYPARRGKPVEWVSSPVPSCPPGTSRRLSRCRDQRTLPALYWVTLCWVCFRHSLPLQKVFRVLGMLTLAKMPMSADCFQISQLSHPTACTSPAQMALHP